MYCQCGVLVRTGGVSWFLNTEPEIVEAFDIDLADIGLGQSRQGFF